MRAIEAAIGETLKQSRHEAAYINVARMLNGDWCVCWEPKYFGAYKRSDAILLRQDWLEHLWAHTGGKGRSSWRANDLKTIRIL